MTFHVNFEARIHRDWELSCWNTEQEGVDWQSMEQEFWKYEMNQKKNTNTITRDVVWDSLIVSAVVTVRPRAGSTSLYWTVLPREEQTSIVRPPAGKRKGEMEWKVGKLMTYLEKLEQGKNTADLHSHTRTRTAVGIVCILLQWGGSWMSAEAGGLSYV